MTKDDEVITIYKPNDIYKVIEKLNKGARELSKYTLEEQMELTKKRKGKWLNNCGVVKLVDTGTCWVSEPLLREVFEGSIPSPTAIDLWKKVFIQLINRN